MWPESFWPPSFWPASYWPKTGADPVDIWTQLPDADPANWTEQPAEATVWTKL